ncbi:MAG: hypothetical protein ACL93V_09060 [Candidatus Electrothrix sp. YB6]
MPEDDKLDHIMIWSCLVCAVIGLVAGFFLAGIGGAILGAMIGCFAGYFLPFALTHGVELLLEGLMYLLLFGIVVLLFFLINNLWNVGRP